MAKKTPLHPAAALPDVVDPTTVGTLTVLIRDAQGATLRSASHPIYDVDAAIAHVDELVPLAHRDQAKAARAPRQGIRPDPRAENAPQ